MVHSAGRVAARELTVLVLGAACAACRARARALPRGKCNRHVRSDLRVTTASNSPPRLSCCTLSFGASAPRETESSLPIEPHAAARGAHPCIISPARPLEQTLVPPPGAMRGRCGLVAAQHMAVHAWSPDRQFGVKSGLCHPWPRPAVGGPVRARIAEKEGPLGMQCGSRLAPTSATKSSVAALLETTLRVFMILPEHMLLNRRNRFGFTTLQLSRVARI